MAYPFITNRKTPNFPKPLDRREDRSKLVFPADLVYGKIPSGRNFYTDISFVDYNVFQQINYFGAYSIPTGRGIKLPIPTRLNDNLVMQWSPVSLTDSVLGVATQAGGQAGRTIGAGIGLAASIGGIATGLALNPLMFLQFQRPDYRQFSLSWTLSPRNEKESVAIKNIITRCKKAAAPGNALFNNLIMTYPQVALVKMFPNDIFGHMIFKPCIITSVQANYTGAPVPSFHKNGAPTVVTLTLNLMEMQFWFREEIT